MADYVGVPSILQQRGFVWCMGALDRFLGDRSTLVGSRPLQGQSPGRGSGECEAKCEITVQFLTFSRWKFRI